MAASYNQATPSGAPPLPATTAQDPSHPHTATVPQADSTQNTTAAVNALPTYPAQPPPGLQPPPGHIAVPLAAVSGGKYNAPSRALNSGMGMASGLVYAAPGAAPAGMGMDMAFASAGAGFVGQQIAHAQRRHDMRDPNQPWVFVDAQSRAGRRALRRSKRRSSAFQPVLGEGVEMPKSGGRLRRMFGKGKADGSSSSSSDSEAENKEGKVEVKK